MLINEIPFIYRVLWNEPIDTRFKINAIEDLSHDIPMNVRYKGLLVWVNNMQCFFVFKNGIEDSDFVAYKQNDILSLDTINLISSIPTLARYPGMLVWVNDTKEMYVFKNGITDSDLAILNNDIIILEDMLEITSIPQSSRHHGRLFYITSTNKLYSFIEPLGNTDYILVNGSDKNYFIIDTLLDFPTLPKTQLKQGTIIYVLDNGLMYILKNGTEFEDLEIFQNIPVVNTVNDLNSMTQLVHGLFVWVNNIGKFMQWNQNTDKWENIYQDSLIVNNESEYNDIINSILRPRFIIRSDTNDVYYHNGTQYVKFGIASIPVYDSVSDVYALVEAEKLVGRLYFIKDENIHYTFVKGISNENFVPLGSNTKITNGLANLNTDIPEKERIVGNLFMDSITNQLYYFTSKQTYIKISSLVKFEIGSTNIIANEPFLINHNLNSTFLNVEIYNSSLERVVIDYTYGTDPLYSQSDNDINNYILLYPDVYDTYKIVITSY